MERRMRELFFRALLSGPDPEHKAMILKFQIFDFPVQKLPCPDAGIIQKAEYGLIPGILAGVQYLLVLMGGYDLLLP